MPSTADVAEIPMPRLSDSMEEGTILKWLLASGEEVAAGQGLVEIETDKANMTYQAERAGTLEILAEEGATLAVGEPIARIGSGRPASPPPTRPTPQAPPASPAEPKPDAEKAAPRPTPLARRAARIHGVEVEGLQGTGAGGRVIKADVLAAAGVAPDLLRRRSPPPLRHRQPRRRSRVPRAPPKRSSRTGCRR
jgi:pyruvate dehydrogenase E2 component (dihydrolipoamide acetyltransferase)